MEFDSLSPTPPFYFFFLVMNSFVLPLISCARAIKFESTLQLPQNILGPSNSQKRGV